jgi:fibronectin-binding autotransporter adhesin
LAVFALSLGLSLSIRPSACASNRIWGNTGTDFNNNGSWSGAAPGLNDVAVFSGAMVTQPNLSISVTTQQLNFSTTASSGYDLTSSNTGIKLTLTNTGTGATSAINAANTSGTNTIDAPIILGAAAGSTQTFSQASGGTLIINGAISNTNSVILSLEGSAIFQLGGNNTYSGGTILASTATLRINSATALGTLFFTINGGTLDNTSAGAITLTNNNAQSWNGDFAFTGTKDLNLGTGTVTMNASRVVTVNGGNLTVGGPITGATFDITKAGTGTLTLNGVVTTSSGAVKINSNSGTLTLAGNNTYTGGTTLNSGSTLNINAAGTSGTNSAVGTGTFTINGGTIDNSSAGAITLATNNAQTWNGDFAFTGTKDLNLGTGAVSLGTTAGTSRTITTNASTLTVGGIISNGTTANSLIKAGAGTLVLGGANTYTGATTVSAGTLQANTNNALGTNAAGTTVSSGAALKLNGVNYSTTEGLTLNGSGISNGGALCNAGTSTFAGAITIASNATISAGGGTLTLTGGIAKNGTTLTLAGGGTINVNTNGITGGSSNSDLVVDGTTVVLNTANSYNGPTTVQNSGVLKLGASNVLPSSPETAMTLNTSSAFDLASFSDSVASLAGDSTGVVKNSVAGGTSTLTVDPGTGVSSTFAGLIAGTNGGAQGNMALVKTGLGTLTLTGTNTFSSTTTVSGGTLIAAGASASALGSTSAITVNSGGTLQLGANGQINDSATVTLHGGTFAKGNYNEGAAGTVGIGALTLTASGSHIDFGTGTVGILTFASFNPGSNILTIDNWSGNYNQQGVSGSTDRLIFDSDQSANLNYFSFTGYAPGATQFALVNGFYELTPIAVPEPATWVASLLAFGASVCYQRRRRAPSSARSY